MIVSIHQPAYLPWLGYLDRIKKSDVFVVLDNVQFEKNSFINRNKILTPQGPQWLTVPVRLKGHTQSTIKDMLIDNSTDWKSKHLDSIICNYKRCSRFGFKQLLLDQLYYHSPVINIADLCHYQLLHWVFIMGIDTKICRASDLPVGGKGSELVLSVCKHLGASTYLSGPFGKDYLKEEDFKKAGIEIVYHEFEHPTYKQQRTKEFVPNMGVIDWWMNVC